jgi:hypothetical protein
MGRYVGRCREMHRELHREVCGEIWGDMGRCNTVCASSAFLG